MPADTHFCNPGVAAGYCVFGPATTLIHRGTGEGWPTAADMQKIHAKIHSKIYLQSR